MSRDEPDRFARFKALQEEAHRRRAEMQRQRADLHRQREEARARRSGKRVLDVESIAAAAIAIADAQGVNEVSMRKIAAVLGSGTMSLYHYVRTKEDLFAAMDDLIMGEILVPARELKLGWRKAVTAIATHTRDAYRRHPWALTIHGTGRPGLNGLKHVEQSLAALSDTGLKFDDRMMISIVVDNFVFGHALRTQETGFEGVETEAILREIGAHMDVELKSGAYPELAAAAGEGGAADLVRRMFESFDPEGWFDTGLEALLDGLSRRFGLEAK